MMKKLAALFSLLTALAFQAAPVVAPSASTVAVAAVVAAEIIATPAQATEVNTDVGFDNPAAWPMAGTGWSVSGSKAVGADAKGMSMLMGTSTLIKRGHRYQWAMDVPTRTAGYVRPFVGLDMSQTSTFTPRPTYNLAGALPIADNFPTANGMTTGAMPSTSSDPVGAFRMLCGPGPLGAFDPEVKPGRYGASHLHQFIGNTGINPFSTPATLRQSGGTTAGNVNSQTTPINRSSYWHPAMLDGKGHAVKPDFCNIYYKRLPASSDSCDTVGHPATAVGICIALPHSIMFLWGYDTATGLNPEMGASTYFACWGPPNYNAGTSTTGHMKDYFTGGSKDSECPVGSKLFLLTSAPNCWDGLNLDTSNHRSHVVFGTGTDFGDGRVCDAGHPYLFPFLQVEEFFTVDANFKAGLWHCSSDEMAPAAANDPCFTFHMDYEAAWSPTILALWTQYCIDGHKSCSGGATGDGQAIKDANTNANMNGTQFGIESTTAMRSRSRYVPTADFGFPAEIKTTGHFTGEFTASESGPFGLMGVADASGTGFTGTVDNLSIQEITTGRTGPATVTR